MQNLRCLFIAPLLAWTLSAHSGLPEGQEAFSKFRYTEARKELAELAASGNAEAMVLMGEMLMRGWGGSRDELKARDYILRAHDAGVVRATFVLGQMYIVGNLVNRDEVRGVDLVRRAAEAKLPVAQSTWGAWLSKGLYGLEKNEVAGLDWFRQAAAQGDALAMNWLGDTYENGRGGVAPDNLVALDWYKKSAELQNSQAMVSAGRIYATGKGVSADGAEALRWLRRAVPTGNHQSYLWIASIFELGRGGVAKSPVTAYAWFAAVPASAAPDALKTVAEGKERLAKLLTAAELEEAIKQSKTVVQQTIAAEAAQQAASAPRKGVYGSGVVVSRSGHIITNEHVVRGCEKVRAQPLGSDVRVLAKDAKNDLALLLLQSGSAPVVRLRSGKWVRLGDELVVLGYPLRGLLSSGPIITTGILNALSGSNDDTSGFQMSATVQPGSSGGPVLDNTGALVGLVRARLLPTGPVAAQNVNFGINLATLTSFLDAHSVEYLAAPANAKPMSVSDIVAQAQKSTLQIECY